jgi:hypothetical protein
MTTGGIFGRKAVSPAWVYRASGTIWRLFPADFTVFVGEMRDVEAKQASFFCVYRQTGEALWEGLAFEERWWIGIEAVHGDRVFLHGFSTPDMPDHKGIISIDLFSGRVTWDNPDLRFILAVDDSVFASKDTTDGRLLLELNYRTGELIQQCDNDGSILATARTRIHARVADAPEFPTPLEGFDLIDERAVTLVHRHCTMDDVVGPVEALKKDDLLFFSYSEHSKNNDRERLKNTFNVLDLKNGNLVFKEILNKSATTATPDSFFVLDDMLYFIRDRSLLTALSINKLSR